MLGTECPTHFKASLRPLLPEIQVRLSQAIGLAHPLFMSRPIPHHIGGENSRIVQTPQHLYAAPILHL